jgi:hypothetical protein
MHESGVHPRCGDTFISKETGVSEDATSKGERGAQDRHPHGAGPDFLNQTPSSVRCMSGTAGLLETANTNSGQGDIEL